MVLGQLDWLSYSIMWRHAPLDLRCLQNQSHNDAMIDKLIRCIAVGLRYDSHMEPENVSAIPCP
jgi:hypothetical protein